METYLVGGAVRDQLLKYPCHERDWVVVGATPDDLIAQGFQPVGKDFPVFLHPQTKEEYALARTERKTGPGYTGFECHTSPDVTLEEDLQRRDLTINAMAQDMRGRIIDPYGGQQDLKAKVLRHVSPAFVEDPLRVLRVARFAARYAHLGFTIAPETLNLMQSIVSSGELNALPGERVWKELERALGEASPDVFFYVLQQCGALESLMPELGAIESDRRAALQRAAAHDSPNTLRFTLLARGISEQQLNTLCDHIKAPNEYRHLALIMARQGDCLAHNSAGPETLLTILEQADAFRKPERFHDWLRAGHLLYPDSPLPDKLRSALDACSTVDPGAIAAQGLKGKAIAGELRNQRIEAINRALNTNL